MSTHHDPNGGAAEQCRSWRGVPGEGAMARDACDARESALTECDAADESLPSVECKAHEGG